MAFAVRTALLFVAAALLLGARGPRDPLPALLARMRAAAGPVWRTQFVSVSRVAVGDATTVVESDGSGLRFTLRHCVSQLCQGTYFDGTRLYSVDVNDTAVPQSQRGEPYLRALRSIASLTFLGSGFARDGRHVDDGGTVMLGGKPYDRLFVVDPQAIAMEVFVDPHTALVRYARDVDGDDTFAYLHYRDVDGYRVPFEVRRNGHVLERYDDRTPVVAPFVPPGGFKPVFDGAPRPIHTEASLAIPVFRCSLGGVTVRCLLDSGNSGLSISSELASRLDAPVVGSFHVSGLGGYATQVVRAGPLRIGNASFPSAYYVVLDDIKRFGYDVVLGADVLGNTRVELDAAHHVVLLGAHALPSGTTTRVPLAFDNFIPVVNVRLGALAAKLAVDTGDESNINLGSAFYAKHSSLFAATEERAVGGVGGSSIEKIGTIPSVTIGGLDTGPQSIGMTETLRGTASGHLGAQFLANFRVLFDYANSELQLSP